MGISRDEIEAAIASTRNTTIDLLGSGDTFTGVGEMNTAADVMVSCITDNSGTLHFDFSVDGTNWGNFPSSGFAIASGVHEFHTAVKGPRYFRVRLINDSGAQSYLRLYTYFGTYRQPNIPLNQAISSDNDAELARSVLVGETQGGTYINVPVSSQGKIQVDLPKTAFGELQVAEKTPQVQVKFPMGLITDNIQVLTNKSGSSVTVVDGLCTITCAGVAESFSQIRSKDVIRYGPGQGMNARFTALFTTGVANSSQWAGPGDDDEMIGFGCDGTSFGILHRKMGELEVYDLTITQGAVTATGTITLTIDGTAVPVEVTSGDSIAAVVAKIVAESAAVFNAGRGWEIHTDASQTITIISLVAEAAGGTFSFVDTDTTGVTATGGFVQVLAGVAPTETITPQASWNVDVCDGTGVSGMTLDPTKINIFDVDFQYLGAGNIFLAIENPATGQFEPVHMMQSAGSSTTPTFRQPTFHINMIAKTESGYSGGALSIKTASIGGFIEGKEAHFGTRHEAEAVVSTNGTTEVVNLVLHNEERFPVTGAATTRNKVEVYPDHLTIINDSTRSVKVKIWRNPTHLNTPPTLAAVNLADSVMLSAAGSGTRTGGTDLLTVAVSPSASKDLDIEHLGLKLRPTDTWAFVATKESGGTDGNVTIGCSWLERI